MPVQIRNLDLYYQNVRGLRTKANEFFSNVALTDASIIVLTETWLCSDISSSDYFPPNFTVFRRDREFSATKKTGGGVLIAIDTSLMCVRRPDLETSFESVWVELQCVNSERILLGAYYLPPDTSPDDFEQCLLGIERKISALDNFKFMVLGDFNVPNICWETSVASSKNHYIMQKSNLLLNFASFTNLKQYNRISNCLGNMLDLCFTNIDCVDVTEGTSGFVPADGYHPPLEISVPVSEGMRRYSRRCPRVNRHNFSAGDYVSLYDHFANYDWSSIIPCSDVDQQVRDFTRIVREGMDQFIPLRKTSGSKFPFWFSRELRNLMNKKLRAHRKLKKNSHPESRSEFRRFRALCKEVITRDRRAYIDSVELHLNKNPKEFWKYVRSRSHTKGGSEITLLDSQGNSTTDVCEIFAHHFQSAFIHQPTHSTNAAPVISENASCIALFVEELLHECVKKMKPSLSSGHDGIPSVLLKAYSAIFIPVLVPIFNNCIKNEVFPVLWKTALVVPVHKSGPKTNVSNYRPISLLCTFSKLFEIALHKILSFNLKHYVIPNQHGFMAGRSTTTNLACFMSTAAHAVANRGQLDVIYFDLSKAFDVVNHEILLAKLSKLDVHHSLLSLLKSYLRDRKCFVNSNGNSSATYEATTGVPQGSVLGPLLFSVFVNDVSTVIRHSSFLQYADDIKMFMEVREDQDCVRLQSDVNAFEKWCTENHLRINSSKTKVVSYTRKTHNIVFPYVIRTDFLERVGRVKDLGVVFDSTLHFSCHVDYVVNVALRALGCACRITKEFHNPSTFLRLYGALCRPHLEYASVVWNGICATNSSRIERVQNKFLSIYGHRYSARTVLRTTDAPVPVQRSLALLTLHRRRELADVLFLYKLIHTAIDCMDLMSKVLLKIPLKTTRQNASFYNRRLINVHDPVSRLGHTYNSSFSETLDIFNSNRLQFLKTLKAFT